MKIIPHRALMARNPLLLLAVFLSAGILVINFLPIPFKFIVIACAANSLLALVSVATQKFQLALLFLSLAFCLCGACLATIEQRGVAQTQLKRLLDERVIAENDPVELTGVIDGPVDVARDGLHFSLRVAQVRSRDKELISSGTVALFAALSSRTSNDDLQLHHGARVRVLAALRRAQAFRNPGTAPRGEYLDRKGYDASGFIRSPLMIEKLGNEKVFLPLSWLYSWRTGLQRQIDSRFSTQTAGVLDAALLGNRYNLQASASERFRAGGTFHVLVISGLHISFIGAVVLLISKRITRRRGIQFVLSTAVLWSYTIAVGADASVVRAASMFTIVALAPVIFRRASSLNALGGTALLLLVWRPRSLFDPSFQLTFLSVLAIIAIAWPLLQKLAAIGSWQPARETPYPPSCSRWLRAFCECIYWSERDWRRQLSQSVYRCRLFKNAWAEPLERFHLQRPARYVFAAVVVSVSVQIVLLPFLLIYFHRLSPASLILNIGVGLLMAAEILVALTALMFAQLSPTVAAPLIRLAELLNWLMVHSVDPFTRIGLASIRLPGYSGRLAVIYAIYYLPLVLISFALWRWDPFRRSHSNRKRTIVEMSSAIQILLMLVVILHPFSRPRADGRLHINFLDVGQGDSALVTMPDGTTLLVDGGGQPNFFAKDPDDEAGPDRRSIGEAVVSEYLWSRGLDSIDYILATHADADHIDGLNDVARNFRVRGALVARRPRDDPEFKKFAETLKEQRVPLTLLGAGDVLRFGSVTATVLWPPPVDSDSAPSGNNDSIVLRLQFGKQAILLTGDIESGAEAAIVNVNNGLKVDVVKVAHHGSRTSSIESFVAATKPRFAIASVGLTSIFGHPHGEVVYRWKASGAQFMTTGECGTITVTTDGDTMTVETFVVR